jgi:hypothetical protein
MVKMAVMVVVGRFVGRRIGAMAIKNLVKET